METLYGEDEDDDTNGENGEVILELMSETQASGARLAPACRVLGISARTVERWRTDPAAVDRRCGPHCRPSNALSAAEEA